MVTEMEDIFIDDDVQMQVPKDFVSITLQLQSKIKSEPMECIDEESTNLNENTFQDSMDICKILQDAKSLQQS